MMKKMMTRIMAMLFVALMLTSLTAYAAAPSEIQPRYTNINSIYCNARLVNGEVEGEVNLKGSSNVTKCRIKLTIQKKVGSSWEDVTTWTETQNGSSMSKTESVTAISGVSYRAKAVCTVWVGTTSESGTAYSGIV